ncbi:MAG: hypothetical protein WAQ33_00605, partial [Gaiellaceae bacterium]
PVKTRCSSVLGIMVTSTDVATDRDDDHQHVEQQRDRGCEPDVDIVGPSEEQIGQRSGLALETARATSSALAR